MQIWQWACPRHSSVSQLTDFLLSTHVTFHLSRLPQIKTQRMAIQWMVAALPPHPKQSCWLGGRLLWVHSGAPSPAPSQQVRAIKPATETKIFKVTVSTVILRSAGKDGSAAGAVDEGDFMQAFEDVPTMQVHSFESRLTLIVCHMVS